MEEINEKFYELVQEQELISSEDHPYDVNWDMYDQLHNHLNRGDSL
jgi:hypothetical protein